MTESDDLPLIDFFEWLFVDESDDFWDLIVDEVFGVGDGVPHDDVLRHDFE